MIARLQANFVSSFRQTEGSSGGIQPDCGTIIDSVDIGKNESNKSLCGFNLTSSGLSLSKGVMSDIFERICKGGKIWEFQTGGHVDSSPCMGPDGTVYVGSQDHNLYAVKDGRKIWEFQTGGQVNSSPCIGPDGTVYVGSQDHNLYAVKDGKKLWEFQTGDRIESSPCISPDGTVYVGSCDGKLYAVKDGKKLWEYITGGWIESSPCIGPDGTVYVGCYDNNLYAIKDGAKIWKFETGGNIHSSPCIGSDGTVYVGSTDGKLYAIKTRKNKRSFFGFNGDSSPQKIWEFQTDGAIFSSPCIGSDGTVYIGTRGNKHRLYAIKDGKEIWGFNTGGYINTSSPCIGPDGTVYLGNQDSKLYAIKDGIKSWEFETGGYIESSPCIGLDETVYVGSTDGKLYAINSSLDTLKDKYLSEETTSSIKPPSITKEDEWVIIGGVKIPVKQYGYILQDAIKLLHLKE